MSEVITKTLTAHEFFTFLGHFDYITFYTICLHPEMRMDYTCRTTELLLTTDEDLSCILHTKPSSAANISIHGSAYVCTVVLHDGLCTSASAYQWSPDGEPIQMDLFNEVS